ncbi:hypothetical protein C8J57DRAFT_1453529 [Mycena rebaudengoi]|nr:hypothetical protein C8J57DRAFT_1453529 [Mycena rebaudengoi]
MTLSKGFSLLTWVAIIHLAGIYLFTSGFLLTRLSLSNSTKCIDNSCVLPPTHKRAVLLIIDALKFDFVSPAPPIPVSPFHHNILTLPRELTNANPRKSFLFNAYSDPPTTTLQRIKALTTGSLPTFVDTGNNFGGSSIAEDSIMKQLGAANKSSAFMGDDTWMSVFPDSFRPGHGDLHTVDEGVIRHLFPLLEDKSEPFDFLVGHFLGVDHVGHRMNRVLTRVVDALDDDTLLIVLDDHGMDRSGDHGGDGILETSSAMWQIDIVPTLSLLLGLPIPFNNLGSARCRSNARSRLDVYRANSSGGELDEAWQSLQNAWTATQAVKLTAEQNIILMSNYTRFNATYSGLSRAANNWDTWLGDQLLNYIRGASVGSVVGILAYLALQSYIPGMDALDCILFFAPFASCIAMIATSPPSFSASSIPFPFILHTLAFLSNSFTFWEDRIIPYLLMSCVVPSIFTALTAPTARLRWRILGFSVLFAACVRAMAWSTVCREEQQPYCYVTFYASSSLPAPPIGVIYLAAPAALALPWALRRVLRISRSHLGLAQFFLPWVLSPALLAGTGFWLLEYADSASLLGGEWALREARAWLVRCALVYLLAGGTLWCMIPLCLDIESAPSQVGERTQLRIIGYANAFGTPYLLWTLLFAIVYITTQLTGQIVLALFAVALIAHLEATDSARDARTLNAALASKQLRRAAGDGRAAAAAFVLTPNMSFALSGLMVILNSVGALFLSGLAAPLVALWNRAPLAGAAKNEKEKGEKEEEARGPTPDTQIKGEAVAAALCVFAPRFMTAVVGLMAVDAGVLLGFGVGVERVGWRVAQMFRGLGRG